ncbi:MAG: hypothetical protein ABI573_01660 [Chloroflexota bacterium]
MNIIQNIVAVIGFILCLPFVIAWVVLAMIRGKNRPDEEADGLLDRGERESWLGRLARRGRVFGERASLLGRSHR